MRIRWWQSIRWRLASGSVLVTLLATALMAFSAIFAIIHFYNIDQQGRLASNAANNAQVIGEHYAQSGNLRSAVLSISRFPRLFATTGVVRSAQGDDSLVFVFSPDNKAVYPTLKTLTRKKQPAMLLSNLQATLARPGVQEDISSLRDAILQAQQGRVVSGEIGRPYLGVLPRAFIAMPIRAEEQGYPIIGVIVMIPSAAANNTLPPFVQIVGQSVLTASLIVAMIVALAAILFSRTITRPLAKLTHAARAMASGNYHAQVETAAQGELGELATTFNEMAAQLNRDVDELRKQEIWRRELLMSITHDLATPLTAIAGLGEALADGVNQSREDYEATGRIIMRETLRLRRLVRDLHMMAKVEAGALHPQRKEIRLAALVDEVLAVLTPEFEREHVEPRNAIPYTLPVVQADADMLSRVFSNLCDNALHYTPAGGTVTIEATPQDETLLVSVTDSGPGIPPEALPRIFERFFRADSARQSTIGGSGLGLAIVSAIIDAHGGNVWAENIAEGGARLLFTLPLQASGQPSLSDAPTLA